MGRHQDVEAVAEVLWEDLHRPMAAEDNILLVVADLDLDRDVDFLLLVEEEDRRWVVLGAQIQPVS
jgi:hypothetical protein